MSKNRPNTCGLLPPSWDRDGRFLYTRKNSSTVASDSPDSFPECYHRKSCPNCGEWLCTDLWMDVAPDDCRKCKEES